MSPSIRRHFCGIIKDHSKIILWTIATSSLDVMTLISTYMIKRIITKKIKLRPSQSKHKPDISSNLRKYYVDLCLLNGKFSFLQRECYEKRFSQIISMCFLGQQKKNGKRTKKIFGSLNAQMISVSK